MTNVAEAKPRVRVVPVSLLPSIALPGVTPEPDRLQSETHSGSIIHQRIHAVYPGSHACPDQTRHCLQTRNLTRLVLCPRDCVSRESLADCPHKWKSSQWHWRPTCYLQTTGWPVCYKEFRHNRHRLQKTKTVLPKA